jgi:hypothetical protein
MRFLSAIVLSFVLCTSLAAQGAAPKLSDLAWLAGCWEMNNASRGLTITEMWMKPGGDAMIGIGRTVRSGKVVDFEFLRIVQDANGLAYISRPSGNTGDTTFRLLRGSANEIVFENPTHDFPQRIIYKLNGDKLHARIEGTKDGKTRGVDFPYTRVKCE